jgi:cyclopropane fatty-acyl-phospholipid synthase-like methyltransferase
VTLTPAEARIVAAIPDRFTRVYARGKLSSDPVYGAVAGLLAGRPLPLLDLGCGIGLLPMFLRAHGYQPKITGVEADVRKVAQAVATSQQLATPAFSILEQDVRQPLEHRGHVTLLDVLHYLPPADQARLLELCAAYASESGARVIIRECLRERTLRYGATVVQESFSRAVRWLRSERLVFPTLDFLVTTMSRCGMTAVDVRPMWGKTPFNNYLLAFQRREE